MSAAAASGQNGHTNTASEFKSSNNLWSDFFGAADQKSVVNENSMLKDEYNLIKNVTQKSRNSSLISSSKKSKSRKNNIHKDQEMVKRKRTSKAQTDGVVINHRSGSSDTSDDSDSKKHSSGHNSGESTPPEHILDGDDVPLVEEV